MKINSVINQSKRRNKSNILSKNRLKTRDSHKLRFIALFEQKLKIETFHLFMGFSIQIPCPLIYDNYKIFIQIISVNLICNYYLYKYELHFSINIYYLRKHKVAFISKCFENFSSCSVASPPLFTSALPSKLRTTLEPFCENRVEAFIATRCIKLLLRQCGVFLGF